MEFQVISQNYLNVNGTAVAAYFAIEFAGSVISIICNNSIKSSCFIFGIKLLVNQSNLDSILTNYTLV